MNIDGRPILRRKACPMENFGGYPAYDSNIQTHTPSPATDKKSPVVSRGKERRHTKIRAGFQAAKSGFLQLQYRFTQEAVS
jgi:hypothetical protein